MAILEFLTKTKAETKKFHKITLVIAEGIYDKQKKLIYFIEIT